MDNLINSPIDNELSKLSPFELKGKIIEMADEKSQEGRQLTAQRRKPRQPQLGERRSAQRILRLRTVCDDRVPPHPLTPRRNRRHSAERRHGRTLRDMDARQRLDARSRLPAQGLRILPDGTLGRPRRPARRVGRRHRGRQLSHPAAHTPLHRSDRAQISRLGHLRLQSPEGCHIRPIRSRRLHGRNVLLLRRAQAEPSARKGRRHSHHGAYVHTLHRDTGAERIRIHGARHRRRRHHPPTACTHGSTREPT